jgi:hypothetical protein
MDDQSLGDKLDEVLDIVEGKVPTGPQDKKLFELAKQAQVGRQKLQKSLAQLQESLDYLRVCIKYQAFDLEATRRENARLRELLAEGEYDV